MASPFRTFRKNQKVWMAGITIMAIIAFVFMTAPAMNFSRTGGGPPAVIQTKYGKLTQPEIALIRQQRKMLSQFLNVLHAYYSSDQKTFRQPDMAVAAVLGLVGPDTENAAIDHWIYARAAESVGVVVDDVSVSKLLETLMFGVPEPQKLLDNAIHYSSQGMSAGVLRRVLREQLLALRFMQLGHQYDEWAGFSATPAERWEYFKRLHQEATIEVAMLTPQDVVKAVKDPTDKVLEDFFNEHKNVEASEDSAQSGFRVPRRVSVDYLEMDEDKIRDGITDAEIQQEYDKDPKIYARDKEEFEKEEKQDKDAREKEEKGPAATTTPENKTPAQKAPAEKAPADAIKNQTKTQSNPPAATGTKPAAKQETESDSKTGPVNLPGPAKPAPSAAKPTGSSSHLPRSPFRLVAFAEGNTAQAAPAASSAEKKDLAAPSSPKPTGAGPATAASSTAKATGSLAVQAAAKSNGAMKPADLTKLDPATKATLGNQLSPEAIVGAKAPRQPIKTAKERLDDLIRGNLADRKVRELLTKVKADIDTFQSERANAEDDKKPVLDVAALAKNYGMTGQKTGLDSKQQLKDTPFGKSQVISPETGQRVDVVNEVFGSTTLFKFDHSAPPMFATPKRLQYLYWKTADVAGKVPGWSDPGVKDDVRRQWKLVQARTLAADATKTLKAEAEKKENAGKAREALVAAKKEIKFDIMQPPSFTWLTTPMSGQGVEISEVGDLTKLDEAFMKMVFTMRPGQVELASNVAKSEFYVVRMNKLTPFKDLFDEFTSPDTAQYYIFSLVNAVREKVEPAWRAQVLADANFKDNRKDIKKAAEGQSAPSSDEPEGAPTPEEM